MGPLAGVCPRPARVLPASTRSLPRDAVGSRKGRHVGKRARSMLKAGGMSNTSAWRNVPSRRVLRGAAMICLVVSLGLALGACSKCDVPNWSAPRACHDGPAPQ